ncbi:MAG TPA: LuxR C-terminal-related transcriptional regulator [Arthrobacter sp.]|nr:LuxR C-terminal-related transcriptional regulator [Arthrobacter sp.]
MPVIGRNHELHQILCTIIGPKDSALVVAGRHGMGKSALLAEIPQLSGCRTVFLRADASESRWPFSGLTALLDVIDDPALTPLRMELELDSTGAPDIPALSGMLLNQLRRRVTGRTVIVLDDADLLDPTSQSVLDFLARRMSGTGLALILSITGDTLDSPFARLPVLHLQPLNFSDTVRMLEVVPVRSAVPAAIHAAASAAKGNPLAAFELYASLRERQAAGEHALPVPLPCPPAFAAAFTGQLRVLKPAARNALELLSLVFRTDIRALEKSGPKMLLGVEDLLAEGLIRRTGQYLRIPNQLSRAYVFADMTAEARAAGHSALAEATGPVDPAAHRWHLSFTAPDRQTPFGLLRGAVDLIRNGEISFAAECIERALTLNPGGAETAARLAVLAEMLFVQGDFVHAQRYLDWALRTTRRPGLLFRLTGLAFHIQFLHGAAVRPSMVLQLVKEFGHHNPSFAASLLASASIYYAERWEMEDARRLLESAGQYQAAADTASAAVLAQAWAIVEFSEGNPSRPGHDHGPDGRRPVLAQLAEGRALSYLEDYDHAGDAFALVLNSSGAEFSTWRELAAVLSIDNEIRAGRVRRAMKLIDALELDHPESGCHRGLRQIFRVWRAFAAGDKGAAKVRVAEAHHFAATHNSRAISAQLAAWQGHFALARGDFAESLAHLDRAAEIGAPLGNPALLRCEADLVEVLVRLGRHGEAAHAMFRLEARAVGTCSPWLVSGMSRCRAILADGEQSLELFRKALDLQSPREPGLERARTLLCYAERLNALGRWQEARDAALRARILFDETGADAWMHRVDCMVVNERAEPARASASPAMLVLSDHEKVLAKMVARGMRNKEIAATLFVSVRTVEVRLTTIYRKLGVESRAQLTALAVGKGLAGRDADVLPVP